jgi:hydrogenase nickel insertion protein HypA
MHELAIATSLAESLIEYQKKNAVKINAAHIKVGVLSGVDPAALEFAWEPALENFPDSGLGQCRLDIRTALVKHTCRSCGASFEFDNWQLLCPKCQQETLRRESGSEFILESVEIENV